jgi:hypothetical protein
MLPGEPVSVDEPVPPGAEPVLPVDEPLMPVAPVEPVLPIDEPLPVPVPIPLPAACATTMGFCGAEPVAANADAPDRESARTSALTMVSSSVQGAPRRSNQKRDRFESGNPGAAPIVGLAAYV